MTKPPYKKLYALNPEQYVEYALCNLEKANNKIRMNLLKIIGPKNLKYLHLNQHTLI